LIVKITEILVLKVLNRAVKSNVCSIVVPIDFAAVVVLDKLVFYCSRSNNKKKTNCGFAHTNRSTHKITI
jgi:hypothetical protein